MSSQPQSQGHADGASSSLQSQQDNAAEADTQATTVDGSPPQASTPEDQHPTHSPPSSPPTVPTNHHPQPATPQAPRPAAWSHEDLYLWWRESTRHDRMIALEQRRMPRSAQRYDPHSPPSPSSYPTAHAQARPRRASRPPAAPAIEEDGIAPNGSRDVQDPGSSPAPPDLQDSGETVRVPASLLTRLRDSVHVFNGIAQELLGGGSGAGTEGENGAGTEGENGRGGDA